MEWDRVACSGPPHPLPAPARGGGHGLILGGTAMGVAPPCGVATSLVSSSQLWKLSVRPACKRCLIEHRVCVGGGGSSGEPEQLPHGKDSQPRTPDSTPPQLLPRGTPPLEGRLGWSGSRLAEPGSPSQHPRPHRAETAYLTHLVVACQAPYGHCPCPGRPLPRGLGTRPVSPCPGRCPFL